jgi:glyoxylase-like metal-dependent hydrolase (beta-lactamase superfamily II)
MKITHISGNSQKLDGGAMFGNAPKAVWEKWISADEHNRIDLATRSLLVQTGNNNLLFEVGIGAYMEPKYKSRFGVQELEHLLLENLGKIGITDENISGIVLSHLHFDHCGGLLSAWEEGVEPRLLFPNAQYYVSEAAWQRAQNPHRRDKASFVPNLNKILEESGRLVIIKKDDMLSFDELELQFSVSDGHTPGMLCSNLYWNDTRLLFAADLIPGIAWIHLPITMGYDRYPELLIDEKEKLLTYATQEDAWLFFTHDPKVVASKVAFDSTRRTFIAHQKITDLSKINA